MSSLTGKLEATTEIEASAKMFHQMLLHKPHHVSNASPNMLEHATNITVSGAKRVPSSAGLIFLPKTAKEIVESVDSENITLRVIEGDILEEFKSSVVKCKATPFANGKGCVVQWVLEYEKLKEDIARPETTLAMLLEVAKDMGAHLTKP
ncbi:putative MLP-like protein 28 [Hibiscus syriacus]|uniref:MLP-like protein 28 n=1 Tax=Hibiscus syriacus TaxID=106335 RepID=A0A6A3ALH6_HIBSY|nr:putative MLP-like protein 28 [Hibiscus syriacus]